MMLCSASPAPPAPPCTPLHTCSANPAAPAASPGRTMAHHTHHTHRIAAHHIEEVTGAVQTILPPSAVLIAARPAWYANTTQHAHTPTHAHTQHRIVCTHPPTPSRPLPQACCCHPATVHFPPARVHSTALPETVDTGIGSILDPQKRTFIV